MSICGLQLYTLCDTGSTHTLIDYNVYQKLPRLTPLYAAPRVQSLTGDDLPLVGACVLKVAGQTHEVLVCRDLGIEFLLGMNVLQRSILDFLNGLMTLGDQKYRLDTTPERFQCYATTCLPHLDNEDLNTLIRAYRDVFSARDTPVNVAHGIPEATIDTGDSPPIRQNPYRLPFTKRQQAEECIQEMLQDGIIHPSSSPWASPITLVPKKDGTTRFCVDYRRLNSITKKDAHPLPHIQDVFDQLNGP